MDNERTARQGGPFGVQPHRITEPLLGHEPRSSVELWSTRAGRQQRVKIYIGDEPDAIDDLIDRAVDAFERLSASDDSPPFRRARATR